MNKNEIVYVVTGIISDDAHKDEDSLLTMPDWILDEIHDDKVINTITALLADLSKIGPGLMLNAEDFRKGIIYNGKDLAEKQVDTIENLLLKHGIIVNLGDVVADEHPDWSKEEISNAVLDIYNNGKKPKNKGD